MTTKSTEFSMENLIPFNETLSRDQLDEMAKAEFNETKEIREVSLQQLKELIREHHLRCITNDDFLLRFLRARKFDVRKSFEALKNYAKQRIVFHNMLSNLRPDILESCLRNASCGFLPYRDCEGRLIIFTGAGMWNRTVCTDLEFVLCLLLVYSYTSEDECVSIKGMRLLADESNFSFQNVMILIRYLGFVTNYLFIVLHGKTRDSLLERIPPCNVPTESEEITFFSAANDQLIEIMKDYLQKLKDENQYFVNEQ